MMQVNRKKGPVIKPIEGILLPKVIFYTLNNGIPVYEINAGAQDILKVEMVTSGSRVLEDKLLAAKTASYLIKEGTRSKSSAVIAEEFDFYGASISGDFNLDFTALTTFSLGRHYKNILPLLAEIFFDPSFRSEELVSYVERSTTELENELEKNDVVAYREFTEALFGQKHIYGYNSTPEMYRALSVEDIRSYHAQYIGTDNCFIVLSGKITDAVRQEVMQRFGQERKPTFFKKYQAPEVAIQARTDRFKGPGDFQNSIIIGRRLFHRNHPDYAGMVVLNTILGGYFGSRLMREIRENKGLTYGISSLMEIMRHDGFFFINTEVDPQNTPFVLDEIYRQLEKLRDERVGEEELSMVKNYILGNAMNMLDGPLRTAKWVKSLIIHNVTLQEGHKIFDKIKKITAEEVQELAIKYLDRDTLQVTIVD